MRPRNGASRLLTTALVAAVIGACGPSNGPAGAPSGLAASATASPPAASGADTPAKDSTADLPLPGPAPRPPLAPVAGIGLPTDEGCARCHQEIAAEQDASLHHHAWQNAYFVRAYAVESTAFCRKCHAPGADPEAEPPPAAREAGVGCTTCHVVPAGVVGVRDLAATERGHVVLGDPRLATPAACGECHEFAFPGPRGVETGPMQDTLGEHLRSAAADKPCQHCHMPEVPSRGGGTHRSHAFRVQGDKAMMARAVDVQSASLAAGEVRLSLAPGAVGHAFPTGDLYRQVEVRAAPIDDAGQPLSDGSREVLGRTFGPSHIGKKPAVTVQRTDTRLAGPRALALKVPAGTRRARWQIVWQRMPPWLAAGLGMKANEHETVILEGTVTR